MARGEPAVDEKVSAVYLVKGDDPSVIADAVRELVTRLVGDDDRALAVEDLPGEEYHVAQVVEAAQTPPFLTSRRVVVAHQVGRFLTDQLAPLLRYIDDPLPTTSLVLVAGGGTTARSLADAVKKAGEVVSSGVPTGRGRAMWVAEQVKRSEVRLTPPALALVGEHLGDEVGRLAMLLETLAAVYGPGSEIGVEEVGPFLGQAGSVAPWDLTDAVDRGDTAAALRYLSRIAGSGGRHPLEVTAILFTHYRRMLRLDGAAVAGEQEAAAALGLTGSTFPARKALTQVRRLGHEGVARAIHLLAEADLALKGELDWPGELVLEVLVARLSRLVPVRTSRGTGRSPARRQADRR